MPRVSMVLFFLDNQHSYCEEDEVRRSNLSLTKKKKGQLSGQDTMHKYSTSEIATPLRGSQ